MMNVETENVGSDGLSSTKRCTACGDASVVLLLRLDSVPVHQNLLYASYDAALSCSVGQIELTACERCGFIFNGQFDSSLLDYSQDYENTQDRSGSFSEHMVSVAERLIQQHALKGKRILEIGCGKGGFLHLIVVRAGGVGKGFDPSYLNEFDHASALTFVKDFFPANQPWWEPDQIVCRHVLEHIAQPLDFVRMIRDAVPSGQFPHLYFEVPAFDWIAEKLAFWDIFYEHCNYFTAASRQRGANKSIAVWGAAAKGSTFLNQLALTTDVISNVIDINPRKQGNYIAGTGQLICAPEFLQTNERDVIYVMNPNYEDEIRQQLNAMNLSPELVVI
ncbi:MAG: methyltransferase domain-containing protein [Candidatus Melainabacteria bacterium]|nr:methyltransferase domain-containing protein [Candidatus Melainabacteria bacterium]